MECINTKWELIVSTALHRKGSGNNNYHKLNKSQKYNPVKSKNRSHKKNHMSVQEILTAM